MNSNHNVAVVTTPHEPCLGMQTYSVDMLVFNRVFFFPSLESHTVSFDKINPTKFLFVCIFSLCLVSSIEAYPLPHYTRTHTK